MVCAITETNRKPIVVKDGNLTTNKNGNDINEINVYRMTTLFKLLPLFFRNAFQQA